VEEVTGRERIVERAVARAVGQPQAGREGAELAVGYLTPQQPSGEGHGVEHLVRELVAVVAHERRIDEADVETRVVCHHHRITDELEQRGQQLGNCRRADDHRLRDAGEHRDRGRDLALGVDKRLQRAKPFAAAVGDGADLGDARVLGRSARRLQVDDAERDVGERRTHVVEAALRRGGVDRWDDGRI
jgi:hypothetical protein